MLDLIAIIRLHRKHSHVHHSARKVNVTHYTVFYFWFVFCLSTLRDASSLRASRVKLAPFRRRPLLHRIALHRQAPSAATTTSCSIARDCIYSLCVTDP